jgi:orotate phosphoribosyltransferase
VSIRSVVAAAIVVAAATSTAGPAASDDTGLPCIEVEVDGRRVNVCEDLVTTGDCPPGETGVVVDVLGRVVEVCSVPRL